MAGEASSPANQLHRQHTQSGRCLRRGRHGSGRHGRSHPHSRCTQITRFPQSSTPSTTSARSPARQGLSIITRSHTRIGGAWRQQPSLRPQAPSRPQPSWLQPSSNSLTRMQGLGSQGGRMPGYSGIFSQYMASHTFRHSINPPTGSLILCPRRPARPPLLGTFMSNKCNIFVTILQLTLIHRSRVV